MKVSSCNLGGGVYSSVMGLEWIKHTIVSP